MDRLTSDGQRASSTARDLGRAMLDSAREGMLVETSRPGANVAAAGSWLEQRSGKRELVVISDFQHGAVSDGDFASVPAGVGILLRKVTPTSVSLSATASGITAVPDGQVTVAQWPSRDADTIGTSLTILARSDADIRALTEVVRQLAPGARPTHSIAVVYPDHGEAASLAARIQPINQPWQGDFLVALQDEALVRNGTSSATPTACASAGAAPVRSTAGHLLASVAAGESGSPFELVVFSCADAGSSAGAALLTAVSHVAAPKPDWNESETVVVPDELLRRWERPATAVEPRGRDETSPDGRWFWLLALLLLALEELMRRRAPRRTGPAFAVERRERVA